MAQAEFAAFVAALLPRLNNDKTWSVRCSINPDEEDPESDHRQGERNETAVVLVDADNAESGGDAAFVKISCVTNGGGESQLWELQLDADTLRDHRSRLGIREMSAEKFCEYFWKALATVDLTDPCPDTSSAFGKARELELHYSFADGFVFVSQIPLKHVCSVPAPLFPLLWKLQSSGTGASIVRQQSRSSLLRAAKGGAKSSPAASSAANAAAGSMASGSPSKRKADDLSSECIVSGTAANVCPLHYNMSYATRSCCIPPLQ